MRAGIELKAKTLFAQVACIDVVCGARTITGGSMMYVCDVCGYVYDPAKGDPDNGVKPGTAFKDIPESWVCPECGDGKDSFSDQE